MAALGRLGTSWGASRGLLGDVLGRHGLQGPIGEVLRAFWRPRSNKDDCNPSFGAGFQAHFWYALDAVSNYFFIVVPPYLEIVQRQQKVLFL